MTVITKYSNRKLYNRDESKYVSLKDLLKMPVGSFTVVHHSTNEDITLEVLLQALSNCSVKPEVALGVMKHCVEEMETSLQEGRA